MKDKVTMRTCGTSTALMALCLALAACGGGGGSDAPAASASPSAEPGAEVAPLPTPVASTSPAAASSAPAASASAPAAVADISCGLNGTAGIEAELLQRVNALRASGAVCGTTGFAATTALAWNTQLLAAAKEHSTDMAQKNYFSHTGQDGRNPGQRVTAAGYIWSTVGENIAGGQRSVEQAMAGWINSPGHCQNLMNPNFRDVAVACVRNDASTYRLYWTMNLGRSR
jgi:uncharacterized protein YkwD